ncbi:MAG: hypothetical protein JWM91_4553 [Rhodospirillales bacterium]|nr:hypothetical protein [Rhodospirillales bacterium]
MDHLELRLLLDERAITAVMNSYCQAMDLGQHDRWLDCFTDDAIYEVLLPNGATYQHSQGRADLARFIATYPVLPGHKHVYVTPVFDVHVDARTAEVSSYWFMLAGDGSHAGISSLGRVLDFFVSSDGRWRIKERRIVTEGIAQAK